MIRESYDLFQIQNENSGKVLGVFKMNREAGGNIVQQNKKSKQDIKIFNQLWALKSVGNRKMIINANSGMAIDVKLKSTKRGANVHQWACKKSGHGSRKTQLWDLKKLGNNNMIINLNSGMCLDVKGRSKKTGGKYSSMDMQKS